MTPLLQFRPAVVPVLPAEEVDRLFALRHSCPHALLGPHPSPSGTVVRTWRHDARGVAVRAESGER